MDTTVLIDVLRGYAGATRRLDALQTTGDFPCICAITAEEISFQLRPRERERLADLIEGLGTAPLGIAEGRIAGWWRRDFKKRGITLSQADLLIAAAAYGLGGRLATGNPKDFPITEIAVEHWPVGER